MSHVDDGTLHAYLDGELSPAEAQGIAAHVAQCPSCRGRLEEERALITRAGELLALAAPPDREVPSFRVGDVKPPPRVWWRVRLPLAWAASVVLALGTGVYLGSGSAAYRGRPAPAPAPAPMASVAPGDAQSRKLAPSESLAHRTPDRAYADARVARRAAAPPSAAPGGIPRAAQEADRIALRDGMAAAERAPAVATRFTLDSARAVLGHDPVVLPGVPIRAVRSDRTIGYAAVVVIQQQLDSSTAIELSERRVALPAAVAVANARQSAADSVAVTKLAPGRPEARADLPAAKRARPGTVEEQGRLVRRVADLEVRISGPLPLDSLQKLLQIAQPVRP